MRKSNEYRAFAVHCLTFAKNSPNTADKTRLLEIPVVIKRLTDKQVIDVITTDLPNPVERGSTDQTGNGNGNGHAAHTILRKARSGLYAWTAG